MPLPDASKKSPRVYTNLQNLDLDNVTFANIQATGNPIAVEEMNEDEMRRLVLVNLARLVTAGEWTGLLEAGGAGGKTIATYSAYPQSAISGMGYNSMANPVLSATPTMQSTTVIYGRPFYASTTGDFDAAQRKRLAQIAQRCPVHKTLAHGVAFEDNATFSREDP